MKDLGSLGKADDEEDPQKAIVSSAVTGRKRINESSTADVLSGGGQQKIERMPSTVDTVSSAAASKSFPPDSPLKSDVDDESASESDASMTTASTKLYKRKRQHLSLLFLNSLLSQLALTRKNLMMVIASETVQK